MNIHKHLIRLRGLKHASYAQDMNVLAAYNIDEVLADVGSGKKEYLVLDLYGNKKSYYVKMNSHRYFTFKKSINCVVCDTPGKIFLLERGHNDRREKNNVAHFNLYSTDNDGRLILMTKDHVVPKAIGGQNSLDNYQTLCRICNTIKSSNHIDNDSLKYIRNIFDTIGNRSLPKTYSIVVNEWTQYRNDR